ncbi:MAG: response regulator transcription factor [Roseiflexaceae bacterium]
MNRATDPKESAQTRKIQLVIIDDHPVIRHGLRTLIELEADMEIIGEASDGPSGLELILSRQPDVVLIDLRMPGMSGVEVMRKVRAVQQVTRFLVLTTYDTDAYLGAALTVGANGYLLKDASPDELTNAVRVVMSGNASLKPDFAVRLLERMGGQIFELTEREYSVLRLMAAGATNRQIANQLAISEHTIKYHIGHLFEKPGVQTRSEAVAVALQRGLVEPIDF